MKPPEAGGVPPHVLPLSAQSPGSAPANADKDHPISGGACLDVRHLSTDFISADRTISHALENVSFVVRPGETLGLVGESGCGKTTTMLSIMRLLPASGRITNGQVFLAGSRPGDPPLDLLNLSEAEMRAYRWKEMAMIFQSAMNALNPVMRVGDQISEAILLHHLMGRDEAEARVDALLELVGIAKDRKRQYPHQYSGGMRQRAMIAMALACRPRLLFADEPTTALDVMIQAQILALLKDIQSELGLAVVLVTHDLGVVAEVCDSVVVMYGGKVAEYGAIDEVYNTPQHPYTQRLLEAFPDLNQVGGANDHSLVSIPGSPPRLNALPPGCRFEPRCHSRIPICAVHPPPLVEIGPAVDEIHPGTEAAPSVEGHLPYSARIPLAHVAACHLCAGEVAP